jgi:hypothetical protein
MIQKLITTANGPASFHVLFNIATRRPFKDLSLTVDSYADEATYLAGGGLIMRHMVSMPSPTNEGHLSNDVHEWLVGDAASPFQGGQIIPDATDSIEALRTRKSAEINAAWIRADSTAFEYSGEQFRAGADDVLRLTSINGYISLTNEMPPAWIGVWKTMADTYIALPDVDSWKPFYTAFVMKGVNNYLVAQALKARLVTAESAADIATIHWPQ